MLGQKKIEKTATPGLVAGDIRTSRHAGRWFGLVGVVLVLVVGFLGIRTRFDDDGCNGKKVSNTYSLAAKYFSPANTADLKRVLGKIEKLRNADTDANCIYPFIVYYINTSDVVNAKMYLERFKKAYKKDVGIADVYSESARSDVDVIRRVENLNKAQIEFNKNRIYFN